MGILLLSWVKMVRQVERKGNTINCKLPQSEVVMSVGNWQLVCGGIQTYNRDIVWDRVFVLVWL